MKLSVFFFIISLILVASCGNDKVGPQLPLPPPTPGSADLQDISGQAPVTITNPCNFANDILCPGSEKVGDVTIPVVEPLVGRETDVILDIQKQNTVYQQYIMYRYGYVTNRIMNANNEEDYVWQQFEFTFPNEQVLPFDTLDNSDVWIDITGDPVDTAAISSVPELTVDTDKFYVDFPNYAVAWICGCPAGMNCLDQSVWQCNGGATGLTNGRWLLRDFIVREVICPEGVTANPEVCDGLDNDCDNVFDEDFDLDGDTYTTCGTLTTTGESVQTDCQDSQPEEIIIIDDLDVVDPTGPNPDEGFLMIGNWLESPVPQAYNGIHFYSAAGTGADKARFTPNIVIAGHYNVYARWVSFENRATDAPFTISHAQGSATIRVDQKDPQFNSQWVLLGTYPYQIGTANYVELSDDANGYVVADAVRFELADFSTQMFPGAAELCDGIDNDCDATFDEDFDADGDGLTICGTWTANGLVNPVVDCNDNSILFPGPEICDGIDDDCDGIFDEDFDEDDDTYTTCGTLTTTGTPAVLDCNDDPADPQIIVDDLDAGFEILSGTWGQGNVGYNTHTWWAEKGDGTTRARWTPVLPELRLYQIFATWLRHDNRATDAPYTIHHANGDSVVRVNQKIAPEDGWELLGTYALDPATAYVELSNDADEWVMADALMFRYATTGFKINAEAAEVCDGFDNNCVGGIDENVAAEAPICTNQQGVCAGAISVCGGMLGWTCGTQEFSAAAAANGFTYEPVEASCNGIDNDCDGMFDESHDEDGDTYTTCGTLTTTGESVAPDCNDDPTTHDYIVDNSDPGFSVISGSWAVSTSSNFYGGSTRWNAAGTGNDVVRYTLDWEPASPPNPPAGAYNVYAIWTAGSNRATDAPFTVKHQFGTSTVDVNQKINNRQWVLLGRFLFDGLTGGVELSDDADAYVIADAVRFEYSVSGAAINPGAIEVCDGFDNDCNTFVDEGVEADAPFCALQSGVCTDSTQSCGGLLGWLACTAQDYTNYALGQSLTYQLSENICDTFDNDCDSTIDEGCP